MGRHKALKLPFLKLKLKSETIYSIFSLLCLAAFILTVFSFNHKAKGLNSLQEGLQFYFGRGAFFFPIVLLFAAGVLIQTKKLKVVKPNWFIGYLIVFFSYLTVWRTGYLGEMFSDSVSEFISRPGTIVLFSTLIIIGFLIIFEIALQDFLKYLLAIFSTLAKQLEKLVGQIKPSSTANKKEGPKEIEFVGDSNAHLPVPVGRGSLAIAKDKTVRSIVPPEAPFIQEKRRILSSNAEWHFPSLELISQTTEMDADRGNIKSNCDTIERNLRSFGIQANVDEINKGPAITQYALKIPMGVNLNKITNLSRLNLY
jgi:S-DNA-T family DNA segregation ATPase FtsK/SpoIIIE